MWEYFHRTLSLFRRRGNRGSIFRNEWVWEFFHRRLPYLGVEATGVLYFVMNGCGKFFTGGFPYLVNFKKELAIS